MGTEASRTHGSNAVTSAIAWCGALAALYLSLAWSLGWPGGWSLRQRLDPADARRAREVAAHARERVNTFVTENELAPAGSIVFLGSSTIERMPLAELFPSRACLNRGLARAEVPLIVALLPRLLPRAPCAGFVVYAGSVDWREGHASIESVLERLARLLDALEATHARAPVALIGLLPDRDGGAAEELTLAALDRGCAELARRASHPERPVAYVTTLREPLSSPSGRLSEAHSADDLHLDRNGYRVLARWLVEDGGELAHRLAP